MLKKLILTISLVLIHVQIEASVEELVLSCLGQNSSFQMYRSEGSLAAIYINSQSKQIELLCDGSQSIYRCTDGEMIASVWPAIAARNSLVTVDIADLNELKGTLICQSN